MFNKTILIAFLTLFMTLSTFSSKATDGTLNVTKQINLDVSPSAVWAALGDFNGLNRWHPAVANSDLNGDGKNAGTNRVLTLGDGAKISETLVEYNDSDMSYTYTITESPLPVSEYVSTLKVEANDKGTTTVTWSSSFNASGVPDEKAIEIISGVYDGGLEALQALY